VIGNWRFEMEHADDYWRVGEQIYREILSRGMIFTQCDCVIHDDGPYNGNSSSALDVLSLKKGDEWQALIWYHFEAYTSDHDNREKKFSLTTDSRFALYVLNNSVPKMDIQYAMLEMLRKFRQGWIRWGARELKCSIGFISGKRLEDVPPSHPLILPTLFSAYANLRAEFFTQVEKLKKTVEPRHQPQVTEALDSLLRRYSAFVAQAQKQQIKQLFGV